MGDESGDAEFSNVAKNLALRLETGEMETESFGAGEVNNRDNESEDLAGNGRPSGTLNAPVKDEDKNRIKDDIREGAGNGRGHGESRRTIGANDRVEHISEHVDREESEDDIEVLLSVENVVGASPEESKNLVGENEAERDEDHAD